MQSAPVPFRYINLGSGDQLAVKNSPGVLFAYQIINTTATAFYLKLYNKALPLSTDTPVKTLLIPANTLSPLVGDFGPQGTAFTVAIGLRITALLADTDTTAVAANSAVVNLEVQ
jgi:subtilisin family serine protease